MSFSFDLARPRIVRILSEVILSEFVRSAILRDGTTVVAKKGRAIGTVDQTDRSLQYVVKKLRRHDYLDLEFGEGSQALCGHLLPIRCQECLRSYLSNCRLTSALTPRNKVSELGELRRVCGSSCGIVCQMVMYLPGYPMFQNKLLRIQH